MTENNFNTFSIVPIEVLQDRRLSFEQMRVLIALFSFRAKNTDIVWPSRQLISDRACLHISNVSAATAALVKFGWLEKHGTGGNSRSNSYKIIVPDLVAESARVAQSATVAESARGIVAEQARGRVAESARGIEHTNENTKEHTNENTKEHTNENTNSARDVAPPVLPPDHLQGVTKKVRATRLPPDWKPSADLRLWAARELDTSPAAVDRVTDGFRDYWTSLPGQKGTKLDWSATFRNWVRRQADSKSKEFQRVKNAQREFIDNSAPGRVKQAIERRRRERGEIVDNDDGRTIDGEFERLPF